MSRPATRRRSADWIRTTWVTSSRCTDEVAHRATRRIGDQSAVGDAAAAIGRTHGKRETVGRGVTYKACRVSHDGAERQLAIQQIVQHNWASCWAIRHVHGQGVLHQLAWCHNLPARWIRALADRYYWINRVSRPATRWGCAHWIRPAWITSARRADEIADRPTRRIGHSSAVGDTATAISCASSKRKAVGSRVTYKTCRVGHDGAERQLAIQQIVQHNWASCWAIGNVHRQGVLDQLTR